ncbi:hypothetical protein FAGKG844_100164 [Frankia sp. AgKG'84/4]
MDLLSRVRAWKAGPSVSRQAR